MIFYVDSENVFTFSDMLIRFHKLWKIKQTYNNMSFINIEQSGNSLVVRGLQFHPSTADGMGLIPGKGTQILHAAPLGQENKTKPKATTSTKTVNITGIFFPKCMSFEGEAQDLKSFTGLGDCPHVSYTEARPGRW